MHDEIDLIERRLKEDLGCEATIHMDPVETDNEQVAVERRALEAVLADVGGIISMHDFRMVAGPSHTNLIFDVVISADSKKTPEEIRREVCAAVEERLPNRFAVVNVDTSFVK